MHAGGAVAAIGRTAARVAAGRTGGDLVGAVVLAGGANARLFADAVELGVHSVAILLLLRLFLLDTCVEQCDHLGPVAVCKMPFEFVHGKATAALAALYFSFGAAGEVSS